MAEKPSIEVTFRQLAATAAERSKRGIAALIVKEETPPFSFKLYSSLTDAAADKTKFTAANYAAITDVLRHAPYRLAVVCLTETSSAAADIADAAPVIEANLTTCWAAIAGATSAQTAALVTWAKAKEAAGASYKALVYNASAPDCMHIVNFATTSVTFADTTRGTSGKVTGDGYIPSLLGILAAANVEGSVTYAVCDDLTDCTNTADEDAAVSAGKLILHARGGAVRIVSGATSLTTTDGSTKTADMQYIETVEAMDMIADDIAATFREHYTGRYKNSRDNQVLFFAAVQGYLADLARENILDASYGASVGVDCAAQRAAWIAAGKSDAAEWTDAEVARRPYKRTVFMLADVKILGAMENLKFKVQLY